MVGSNLQKKVTEYQFGNMDPQKIGYQELEIGVSWAA